jgi:hypothetical protein
VEGDLELSSLSSLTTLAGLASLVAVDGDLTVKFNDSLVAVDLPALEWVGGDLEISWNAALVRIDGPDAVEGDAWVRYNDLLPDLSGWGLVSVGHWLTIEDNPSLSHLYGLEGLAEAPGVILERNDALVDLAGLDGLTSVSYLAVTDNGVVTLDGLGALHQADAILIADNASLDRPGAMGADLEVGGGALRFAGNDRMTSFEGLGLASAVAVSLTDLPALESYAGLVGELGFADFTRTGAPDCAGLEGLGFIDELVLEDTSAVTLAGLENLRTVTYNLWILDNAALVDVTALHGLTSVGGDVEITGNTLLDLAAAQGLADAIDTVGGTTTVSP